MAKDNPELLNYLQAELAEARAYDDQRAQDRKKAHQLLMGKRLGKVRKGDPSVVSSDSSDVVESLLADLLEIYGGTDEPISIKPRRAEARRAAKLQSNLIKYQLQRQLPWFEVLYTVLKDGLSYRNGVIQWGWDFVYEWEEVEYERITAADLEEKLWDGGEMLEEGEPWLDLRGRQAGLLNCKLKERRISKDQPFVRAIMPGAFVISPSAKSIRDAAYCAVYDSPTWFQVQEEGAALGYDLDGVEVGPINSLEEASARLHERGRDDPLGKESSDPKRGRVERWVHYFRWPHKGGMKHFMATTINDKLVAYGPNPYGRPNFEKWSPILDTHNFEGVSIIDLVEEVQHIKTAIYRALLKNIGNQLRPQTLVERGSGVNLNDLLRGSEVLQANPGKANAVKPLERASIGADAYRVWEMVQGIKEERVGVTRLNQGLEGQSLNKTARGLMSLMEQANKRIRLIARLFGESLLKPLFRALIWMNQNFLDRELILALSDEEDTVIRPEDLGGDFDLIVNVGVGNTDKAMAVQQGLQLLQVLGGLSENPAAQAMVKPRNLYELLKTIFENMGWHPGPYLSDPEEAMEEAGGRPGAGAAGGAIPPHGAGPEGPGISELGGIPGAFGALAGAGREAAA